jgi:hypothetical protein
MNLRRAISERTGEQVDSFHCDSMKRHNQAQTEPERALFVLHEVADDLQGQRGLANAVLCLATGQLVRVPDELGCLRSTPRSAHA